MSQPIPRETLLKRHCKPLDKGSPPASAELVRAQLALLPGWQGDASGIHREAEFKNYYETMAFVNAVAYIAHGQDHHPDLTVGYNRAVVNYSTHSVGGVSENDFISAAKVSALIDK